MTDTQVDLLIEAIVRHSAMHADEAGLTISFDQLRRVYEAVGQHYARKQATDSLMPTVGDLLRHYEALDSRRT